MLGRCVLLSWIIVGQGPIAFVLDAHGGCLGIFFRLSFLFSFSLSVRLSDID